MKIKYQIFECKHCGKIFSNDFGVYTDCKKAYGDNVKIIEIEKRIE